MFLLARTSTSRANEKERVLPEAASGAAVAVHSCAWPKNCRQRVAAYTLKVAYATGCAASYLTDVASIHAPPQNRRLQSFSRVSSLQTLKKPCSTALLIGNCFWAPVVPLVHQKATTGPKPHSCAVASSQHCLVAAQEAS